MMSTFLKERLWVVCKFKSLDISEIMIETTTEPSPIMLENKVIHKQRGEINEENTEKRFITSPADIDVHRKV